MYNDTTSIFIARNYFSVCSFFSFFMEGSTFSVPALFSQMFTRPCISDKTRQWKQMRMIPLFPSTAYPDLRVSFPIPILDAMLRHLALSAVLLLIVMMVVVDVVIGLKMMMMMMIAAFPSPNPNFRGHCHWPPNTGACPECPRPSDGMFPWNWRPRTRWRIRMVLIRQWGFWR